MRLQALSRSSLVVLVLLAPMSAATDETSDAGGLVRIVVRDASGDPLVLPEGSRIEASEADAEGEPRVFPLTTSQTEAFLPPGSWRVCLRADGLWAPCGTVEVAQDSIESTPIVTITAWRAAALAGRLRLEGEEQLPPSVDVTVGPPPGPGPRGALDESTLSCPVAQNGRFECPVPATEQYAAVRHSGFVGRYFWDLAPAAGEVESLGEVYLRRGASLSGSIDLRRPGVIADRISVQLTPAMAAQAPTTTAGRLETGALTAAVGPHGFFQFAGIDPGSYMLEVRHPSFATTRIGPYRVFAGKETALRAPVELLPPIQIDVSIDPPSSPLDRPWRVEIYRARDWSAGSDRIFHGRAGEDGQVRLAGQSPGLFTVVISDDTGNTLHRSQTRIGPGESGFIPVAVPLIRLSGELRLGGEAVAGDLLFGGRHGALRSRMTADEEGRFFGVLSREGEWEVEILLAEPPLRTTKRVEVEAGPDGTTDIVIDLPATEVFGRVVDADGRPVDRAEVQVQSLSEFVHTGQRTGADGEFRFRAVPTGPAAVSARATLDGGLAVSTPVRISIDEDLPSGPLELVLQRLKTVAGRVVTPSGPAPGATLHATTLDTAIPATDGTVTDSEGRFELRLPGDAATIGVTVLPPGGFLTTAVVSIEELQDVPTAGSGGTLVVVRDGADDPDSAGRLWVQRDGVVVSPALLVQWMRGHGVQPTEPSRIQYPRMGEGLYRVCEVDEAGRRETLESGGDWLDAIERATRCAEGFLPPGGTLELTLDSE